MPYRVFIVGAARKGELWHVNVQIVQRLVAVSIGCIIPHQKRSRHSTANNKHMVVRLMPQPKFALYVKVKDTLLDVTILKCGVHCAKGRANFTMRKTLGAILVLKKLIIGGANAEHKNIR